jgi:T-complex protein 1 subunit zeta
VVPGAGAFEIACANHLKKDIMPKIEGRAKLGVEAYAEAMLVVPKTLAENSGQDVQDSIIKLMDERNKTMLPVGLNCATGEPMLPVDGGIYDNFRVKRQCLFLSTVLATQLLLVDEVMKAGKQMGKQAQTNTGLEEDMAE